MGAISYTAAVASGVSTKQHPADRLADAMERAGSPLCVGLDPVLDRLPDSMRHHPDGGLREFTESIVRTVAPKAAAIKFQSACYERHLAPGLEALQAGMQLARALGLLVILDAKRGDIGISASHYAAAARELGADWVTVSPYLGLETIEPFLEAGLGTYVLVRTSNPGSDSLQRVALAAGPGHRVIADEVAAQVAVLGGHSLGSSGGSAVGAVVGATKSSELSSFRTAMPAQPLLLPGIGAQGATVDDVADAFRPGTAGALATSSRAIIFAAAGPGESWDEAVHRSATTTADELRRFGARSSCGGQSRVLPSGGLP